MRFSARAGRELREAAAGLTPEDLYPGYQTVVADGWLTQEDGAVLLRAFREGYHGDRASFQYVEDYEAAVNGRAIPDLDLPQTAALRVPLLARRGLAFAWQALCVLNTQLPGTQAVGYVSIAPVLFDPQVVVGSVTFCSLRDAQPPYRDRMLLDPHEIVFAVDSDECTNASG